MRNAGLIFILVALCGCGAIGEGRHRVAGVHAPHPADWWLNPAYCTGASGNCGAN
jgi:hypothetical protein